MTDQAQPDPDPAIARRVLKAADAVMFSDESVVRAAKAMYASQYADPFERASDETKAEFLAMARAAVAALRAG